MNLKKFFPIFLFIAIIFGSALVTAKDSQKNETMRPLCKEVPGHRIGTLTKVLGGAAIISALG
jgi:hypothetical protein